MSFSTARLAVTTNRVSSVVLRNPRLQSGCRMCHSERGPCMSFVDCARSRSKRDRPAPAMVGWAQAFEVPPACTKNRCACRPAFGCAKFWDYPEWRQTTPDAAGVFSPFKCLAYQTSLPWPGDFSRQGRRPFEFPLSALRRAKRRPAISHEFPIIHCHLLSSIGFDTHAPKNNTDKTTSKTRFRAGLRVQDNPNARTVAMSRRSHSHLARVLLRAPCRASGRKHE